MSREGGFSLVELIAVITILAVLSAIVIGRFQATGTQQVQASRDLIVAALHTAQQRAMAQANDVRIRTTGSSVDVQQLVGSTWQSVRVGNVQYPLTLSSTVSTHTLTYNRLGQTEAGGTVTIALNQGGSSADVQVYTSGFAE